MDLEKLRAAFFYRHLGPHGPKEITPLPPELLRRAQTALILSILLILQILLQTTKKRTPVKPMARSLARRNSRKGTLFRSVRTCMSIARRPEKDPKVR